MIAIPPTTPPAIAPAFVLVDVDVVFGDGAVAAVAATLSEVMGFALLEVVAAPVVEEVVLVVVAVPPRFRTNKELYELVLHANAR
jgi:hypothetical protein